MPEFGRRTGVQGTRGGGWIIGHPRADLREGGDSVRFGDRTGTRNPRGTISIIDAPGTAGVLLFQEILLSDY